MKFQPYILLGVLAVLSVCSAHIGGGQLMLQDINPQVYCGRNLARSLAEICSLQNMSKKEKKEDAGVMFNAIIPPYYKDPDHYGWPWLAPHRAHGLSLPNRGKRFIGIVNECCEKPCSIDEMLSYC